MSGALVINEIMYDLKNGSDDGREWIEVYNNSDASVDLSTFKFFEADTNHKIVSVAGGENI
ncbi:MAG: lamin tail domain-containing protein, partial [Patescibacteria group bacterium]